MAISLSLPEVQDARQKVLLNAEQLLQDADLLQSAGRHPRAFVLAHLCCEELQKLPMLHSVALALHAEDDVDWQKLNRRMTSHRDKLRGAARLSYMLSDIHVDDCDLKALEIAIDGIPVLNNLKNAGLYAGFHEGKFIAPHEVVDVATAEAAIELAKLRLEEHRWFEQKYDQMARTSAGRDRLAEIWREVKEQNRILQQIREEEDNLSL